MRRPLDWGSTGHRFKSCQPGQIAVGSDAPTGSVGAAGDWTAAYLHERRQSRAPTGRKLRRIADSHLCAWFELSGAVVHRLRLSGSEVVRHVPQRFMGLLPAPTRLCVKLGNCGCSDRFGKSQCDICGRECVGASFVVLVECDSQVLTDGGKLVSGQLEQLF